MREHEPSSEDPDSADRSGASVVGDVASPLLDDPSSYWQRARLIALGIIAVIGAFLLALGMLTSGAAMYTSRSQFCISCHIMEPYYVSWQESSHKDVACIKCHFPPGGAEKICGKMVGLVQF